MKQKRYSASSGWTACASPAAVDDRTGATWRRRRALLQYVRWSTRLACASLIEPSIATSKASQKLLLPVPLAP